MGRPKLLLLDEPSLGIAPLITLKIFEVIRELNRQGMAILLVEQAARLALKLAHRGYVLETGTITMTDRAEKLLNDPPRAGRLFGGVTISEAGIASFGNVGYTAPVFEQMSTAVVRILRRRFYCARL